MGYVELAFFHLLTHALFKSLLFLCAGAYIHGAADCQDIRFLGGVAQGLPVSSIFFISCSISLCGFPFLSGFYSKDLILEMFIVGGINNFILFIILVGTLFTVTYSFRLGVFVFLKNLGLRGMSHFGETLVIAVPIRGLYTASVLAGSALAWVRIPDYLILLPMVWKLLVLSLVLAFSFFVYEILVNSNILSLRAVNLIRGLRFIGGMWFIPVLSTGGVILFLRAGEKLLKYIDQGWLEHWGGQGINSIYSFYSSKFDLSLSSGLKMYFFSFILLICGLLIFLYLISLKRA